MSGAEQASPAEYGLRGSVVWRGAQGTGRRDPGLARHPPLAAAQLRPARGQPRAAQPSSAYRRHSSGVQRPPSPPRIGHPEIVRGWEGRPRPAPLDQSWSREAGAGCPIAPLTIRGCPEVTRLVQCCHCLSLTASPLPAACPSSPSSPSAPQRWQRRTPGTGVQRASQLCPTWRLPTRFIRFHSDSPEGTPRHSGIVTQWHSMPSRPRLVVSAFASPAPPDPVHQPPLPRHPIGRPATQMQRTSQCVAPPWPPNHVIHHPSLPPGSGTAAR